MSAYTKEILAILVFIICSVIYDYLNRAEIEELRQRLRCPPGQHSVTNSQGCNYYARCAED